MIIKIMKLNVKTMVNIAVLISLSVLLKRFLTIHLPVGILNFGGFPIIFAGFFLGPYAGAITGILSDITGYIAFPRGPYIPIFTITSMLTGALPPLIILLLKRKENATFLSILIAVLIPQVLTKLFIIPLTMQFCFGIPFFVSLIKTSITAAIHIPIYSFFVYSILQKINESYIKIKKDGDKNAYL